MTIHRLKRQHGSLRRGLLALALLLPLTFIGNALGTTPTPVLLGTAGDFAVLAGSGITNTGASIIAGDVGSSPISSETGFAACPGADCVTMVATNHTDPNPNDTVTQNAKAALTTAYGTAAGQTPTAVPTELAGQTLTAGVYASASGTFGMTGTLVLDGQNNADATFIFQTTSTLITGGTGNVSLIRGAQACNVFWQVGSAATLGAGSTLRGTILAHDDISLGDGVTVDGRLLAGAQGSGAGAVTLIHDTIIKPPTCIKQADVDAAAAAAASAQAAATAAAANAQAAAAAANAAAAATAAANTAAANAAAAAATAAAERAAKEAVIAAEIAAKEAQVAADAAIAADAAAAKAAAAKATAAAKVAAAKAKAAKTAAAKAKAAKAAKAQPARRHVGLTG